MMLLSERVTIMVFLYDLLGYISYFSILIIFSVIAIIFAKRKIAWFLYAFGGILTLLSILGLQKSVKQNYLLYQTENKLFIYWIIYFILMVLFAVIIVKRKNSPIKEKDSNKNTTSNFASYIPNNEELKETWCCEKCGANNPKNSLCCKTCGNYK